MIKVVCPHCGKVIYIPDSGEVISNAHTFEDLEYALAKENIFLAVDKNKNQDDGTVVKK